MKTIIFSFFSPSCYASVMEQNVNPVTLKLKLQAALPKRNFPWTFLFFLGNFRVTALSSKSFEKSITYDFLGRDSTTYVFRNMFWLVFGTDISQNTSVRLPVGINICLVSQIAIVMVELCHGNCQNLLGEILWLLLEHW